MTKCVFGKGPFENLSKNTFYSFFIKKKEEMVLGCTE